MPIRTKHEWRKDGRDYRMTGSGYWAKKSHNGFVLMFRSKQCFGGSDTLKIIMSLAEAFEDISHDND